MQLLEKTVLFDDPDLKVVYRSAGRASAAAAVTFTNWAPDPARNLSRGFAEGLFVRHGVDEISVQNARNDWYQNPRVIDALRMVRAQLDRYRRVITYGASMGGYACLNFSAHLDADVCIALSPQISVDPCKTGFETRWQRDIAAIRFGHDDVNGSLSARTRHIVLFDPDGPDALHVAEMDARRIERIALRHSGHFTLNTIKDLGLLDGFFRCVLAGGQGIDAFERRYHEQIRPSAWRLVALAERCIRRPARLLRLCARFRAAPSADPVLCEKLGLYLILAREYGEALKMLHTLPLLDDRAYAIALRARAHAGIGHRAAARGCARQLGALVGRDHDYSRQLRALEIAP